ncbi:hypothetical protein EMIT0P74_80139 [Pseudomonas sp. IT-P74]
MTTPTPARAIGLPARRSLRLEGRLRKFAGMPIFMHTHPVMEETQNCRSQKRRSIELTDLDKKLASLPAEYQRSQAI